MILYNCGLVFGWEEIRSFFSRPGDCDDCVHRGTAVLLCTLRMHLTICEIVADVILCKQCYEVFFSCVMQRITDEQIVEYDKDRDEFGDHVDKVFDFNVNKILLRRSCDDVTQFALEGSIPKRIRWNSDDDTE